MATDPQADSSPEQETLVRNNGETQHHRNAAARQLLRDWMADESGYEEKTWPLLKQALENNYSGNRKLFHD